MKKTTPSKTKSASKKQTARKPDPLAKYKEEAAPLLRIMFDEDDDTPNFMRDEVYELLTELENSTQVFWNERAIAEAALPLMLKKADAMGIDWQSRDFLTEALSGLYSRGRDLPELSEYHKLEGELEADAEAISRILQSPHVPVEIKDKLGDGLNNLMNEEGIGHETPDVLRVAFPAAIRKLMREKAEGGAGDEASE